jgi:hypothetical protein
MNPRVFNDNDEASDMKGVTPSYSEVYIYICISTRHSSVQCASSLTNQE